MLPYDDLRNSANALWCARQEGRALDPEEIRLPTSEQEATLMQELYLLAAGEPTAGWKIGAASLAAKRSLRLSQPLVGPVLASALFPAPDRQEVAVPAAHVPGYEVELVLEVSRRLGPEGLPYLAEDLEGAISGVRLGVEVMACRLAGGPGKQAPGCLHIADGGGNAALVVGTLKAAPKDLTSLAASLEVEGAAAVEGSLAALPGSPFEMLAIVANQLGARGRALAAGDLVSTGAAALYLGGRPGQRVTARMEGLGSISFTLREPVSA